MYIIFPFLYKNKSQYENWKNSDSFFPNYKNRIYFLFQLFLKSKTPEVQIAYLKPTSNKSCENRLAIQIHVYYPEIFDQILLSLQTNVFHNTKLFISCRSSIQQVVYDKVSQTNLHFHIQVSENRGRDIYPFLALLPKIMDESYNLILKLHTKKSKKEHSKQYWLEDILEKLLDHRNVNNILQLFTSYPELGVLGPEGHVLPMYLYYGKNSIKVLELCEKLNLQDNELRNLVFVGGTMFYARPAALKPLLNLNLGIDHFEEEAGQLDGTLAHALERMIGASVTKAGMVIADTGSTLDKVQFTVQTSYPFAK